MQTDRAGAGRKEPYGSFAIFESNYFLKVLPCLINRAPFPRAPASHAVYFPVSIISLCSPGFLPPPHPPLPLPRTHRRAHVSPFPPTGLPRQSLGAVTLSPLLSAVFRARQPQHDLLRGWPPLRAGCLLGAGRRLPLLRPVREPAAGARPRRAQCGAGHVRRPVRRRPGLRQLPALRPRARRALHRAGECPPARAAHRRGRGAEGGGNGRQTRRAAVGVGAGGRRRARNRRPSRRGAGGGAGERSDLGCGGHPGGRRGSPPARRQTLPLPLQNPQYEIKDGAGTLHSGIGQPAAYYSYDHSLGQYQCDR